ncbi:unnamed protein product [Linum trigynum]|uniref:Uncharacterized protein n=1 Tax=Linum trigynum TaxID=586398 RepID=A0AAV2DYC8_9ROSI
MSRSNFRESLVGGGGGGGGRTLLAASHHLHRRGHSLNSLTKDSDENLDLFSRNRRSFSLAPSDDPSDATSVKLGRLSLGSAKVAPKPGIDDLLASIEGGKNDYDWLLTPPGTPLFPSADANESSQPPPPVVAPRNSAALSRSTSTTKASRLSVSQSESYHSTRPARSSSVTRSSTTASQFTSYSSNRSPSSILNTSSTSVSSYIRPSSPLTRSPSIGRPSTPSGRSSTSRPSTPSRVRTSPSVSVPERSRPSQPSRPSTPTSSRPHTPVNLNNPPAARSSSRPSTPTRRAPVSSISSVSTSGGRPISSGRTSAPSSRPSSPGPRVRALAQQPVVPPDFPLDTPPNLRTTLPERPLSAGRSRPGASIGGRGTQESAAGNGSVPRRNSSPIVTRGRVSEPPGRGRISSNGHAADVLESRRSTHGSSDSGARRTLKSSSSSSTSADSTGFGRTISKKSLDMAIRHMDIRNGAGGTRPLTGTTLFPQSIRGGPNKTQSQTVRSSTALEAAALVNGNSHHLRNGEVVENGHYAVGRHVETGNHHQANEGRQFGRLGEGDVYESSRYDAMLLKEDVKNMNWLHSIDDKFDQGSIFDHGFEPLPEPFAPL